ncbi:hypothetical protein M9434_001169 [Picochlorum sp. BPE23]|nr:hypothetical protein M9434_001169 [Picochlorum sp. BPE23]
MRNLGSALLTRQVEGIAGRNVHAPPKVALLFLTRGPMPLEAIWRDFLESCPIPWETLFRIHVHLPKGKEYPKKSLFHGRETDERVHVQWGNHSMIEAERILFSNALKDPSVQTCVLLSEDSIPLYPALLVYVQLSRENTSRVNVCANPDDPDDGNKRMNYRWVPEMEEAGVTQSLWRKSSQWIALKRQHAQMVVDDTVVNDAFARECYVAENRFCVSDEHYIPTLLALKGAEDGCDCQSSSVQTIWTPGAMHPKVFGPNDATEDVIRDELREENNKEKDCGTLVTTFEPDHQDVWHVLLEDDDGHATMLQSCPLFARKIDLGDSSSTKGLQTWQSALESFIW